MMELRAFAATVIIWGVENAWLVVAALAVASALYAKFVLKEIR